MKVKVFHKELRVFERRGEDCLFYTYLFVIQKVIIQAGTKVRENKMLIFLVETVHSITKLSPRGRSKKCHIHTQGLHFMGNRLRVCYWWIWWNSNDPNCWVVQASSWFVDDVGANDICQGVYWCRDAWKQCDGWDAGKRGPGHGQHFLIICYCL